MVAKYHDVTYTEDYIPTIFTDQKNLNVTVDGKTVKLYVNDTGDSSQSAKNRKAFYDYINVFIVCFAINDKKSFDNAYEKWRSEIREVALKVPIILVGTKSDLRNDPGSAQKLVSQQDAADNVSSGYFSKYVECSTNQNSINEVFETAAREYLAVKSKEGCGCDIL
ncbi:MAG: putative ras family member protein [Streblomastix strix]|uniref:Putative ras family member protein n=1 Tax=Streblomastix strix TaxID=222440 RepID=A0A5J4TEC8_9EUKA|nr:MAG: putative ras family member protein [Streblomastix strix]